MMRRRWIRRWGSWMRCWERLTDLVSLAEARSGRPCPDLPSLLPPTNTRRCHPERARGTRASEGPAGPERDEEPALASEGPAGGVASTCDPATQAAIGLRPDGRPDPVRRRPGDPHQRPGARHPGNPGPAPGALAHLRGRRGRDVQPDAGHLA